MPTRAELLAEKLEGVLQGVVPLEKMLTDTANFKGVAKSCYHGLQHFLPDADIRARDSSYKAILENEMRKLINLFRSGADSETLAAVTFLGSSDK